jgi:hypothetical protein
VKIDILSKAIYRLYTISRKFQCHLHNNRKINYEIHMEAQNPQIIKAILSKKSNAGEIIIPDFIVTKTAWYWHKDSHEDQ